MLPGLVLVALVACAVAAGRWGGWWILWLGVTSVVWLLANGPMEGGTLVIVSSSHGVTAADLAGLAGLALAAALAAGLALGRR